MPRTPRMPRRLSQRRRRRKRLIRRLAEVGMEEVVGEVEKKEERNMVEVGS